MIGEKWIRFYVNEISMMKIDFEKGEITPETSNSTMLAKAKEWIERNFNAKYDAEKAVWIGNADEIKKEIESRSEYYGQYIECKGLKNPSPDNYVVEIKFVEDEKDSYSYSITLNTGEVVFCSSY